MNPIDPPQDPAGVNDARLSDETEPLARDAVFSDVFAALLRRPRALTERFRSGDDGPVTLQLFGLTIAGLLVYGLLLGSWSGGTQWWAAPAKVVATGVLACAFCAPSLFIFYCLGQGPARLGPVLRALLATAAVCSTLLLGFAPVLWIFSQSTESLVFAGVIHLALVTVSLSFALGQLGRALRALGMNYGAYMLIWGTIFLATVFQLSTALRPTLGSSPDLLTSEKRFFLMHWSIEASESARTSSRSR